MILYGMLYAVAVGLPIFLAAVVGRTRARRAHEDLGAVGERHVTTVRPLERVVLGLVAVHDDLGARHEAVPAQAPTEQRVRRAALDHPDLGRAVVVLDLHVNPRVGVHPLEAYDFALEPDRRVAIELGTERVVRGDRYGRPESRACRAT